MADWQFYKDWKYRVGEIASTLWGKPDIIPSGGKSINTVLYIQTKEIEKKSQFLN